VGARSLSLAKDHTLLDLVIAIIGVDKEVQGV